VSTVTLDSILKGIENKKIYFLKIDCEGAEFEFLEGKEKVLSSSVGYIAMEYHEIGGRKIDMLKNILFKAGFKISINPMPRWHTGMLSGHNASFVR